MIVIKRNGAHVPFDAEKISIAIDKAFQETGYSFDYIPLFDSIMESCQNWADTNDGKIHVEDVQDIVENTLMEFGYCQTARSYIKYRFIHELARQHKNEAEILQMIQGDNEYWRTENSNKDARLANTQRDYIAGIVSKDLARTFIFPKDAVEAHDEGIIHIHDMDFSAERTLTNCCLVNLEDILQNGTVINGIKIEKPHRLLTAATIASQVIAAVSGAQYGGQTITLTHLAPFVRDAWNRHYEDALTELSKSESSIHNPAALAEQIADSRTNKEVQDAIQTLNYQINSFCLSRAQTPFVTINMYLGETEEYKEELAMLIEEVLLQRIKGMKNRNGQYITVAFPKLVYVLEEDNIHPDSPYWYLTELAAECTAKRMVPDYVSEKVLKQMKIAPNGESCCYPPMGCRSFLTSTYLAPSGKPEFYGRGNIGVCTINLADAALSTIKYAEEHNWVVPSMSKSEDVDDKVCWYDQAVLEDKFWEIMEARTELCYKVQKVRFDRLIDTPAEVNPILWCDGALSRLNPEDKIGQVLIDKHFTSSLGYAGLYECVKAITGQSHTEEKGKEFAMQVLQFLNDKCEEWKQRDPIDYSVYGTPIESTTYKFAQNLQRRFGVIPGITDRDFITNSYHVFVEEAIDPYEKIVREAEFQKLSPGGCISYIETTNLQDNLDAILNVMQFMYENIAYCEFNTKLDTCEVCQYEGEITLQENKVTGKHEFVCPQCGNDDFNKMNVARRVCG